jgi:predicted porin
VLAGLAELKSTGYTIAGSYNLSKRTSLYAAYVNTQVESGAVNAILTNEGTTFGAGVVHLF